MRRFALLCVCLVAAATIGCEEQVTTAQLKVVGKSYTPSGSDIGLGMDSKGNAIPVFSSHGEAYVIMVLDEGEPHAIRCNATTWTRVHEGDTVLVTQRGSGIFLTTEVSELPPAASP